MKLKITLEEMPAWKQDMIDADFRYFQADMKFQLCEAIEKIKNSHGLSYRILRLMKRSSKFVDATLDSFLTNLEVLKAYQVFAYNVKHEENIRTVVDVEINDDYFMVVHQIRQGNPMLSKMGMNRKDFINKTEKELKKTYTDKLNIEEYE